MINGILWKLRTGAPWRDVPERYGPWKTCHERLRIWAMDGTWARILEEAVVKDDAAGEVEWVLSVDSTSIRAHQHAAGARNGVFPIKETSVYAASSKMCLNPNPYSVGVK